MPFAVWAKRMQKTSGHSTQCNTMQHNVTHAALDCLANELASTARESLRMKRSVAPSCFEKLNSQPKREAAYEKWFGLVSPEEHCFAYHEWKARRTLDDQLIKVIAPKTFQYIPVKKTLEFLFGNYHFRETYFREKKARMGFVPTEMPSTFRLIPCFPTTNSPFDSGFFLMTLKLPTH